MNAVTRLVDFDDRDFDPFIADELMFGDTLDPYAKLAELRARGPVHALSYREYMGLPADHTAGHLPHYTIVGYDEVLVAEFFAQEFRYDVVIERGRLEQTAGNFFPDVDVWKTAVTHHHAPHAIVATLKELDVRREILRDESVVREVDDWHLFVRIHLAGADSGKVLQATEQAAALETTHVNGGVTKNFARRASERSRIETVRQQVAILGHDRHHGGEVDVEAQHAQHFAGDPAECARGGKIAVLANRAGGRHRCEYATQPVNQPAFLIDAEERWCGNDFANAVEQRPQLFWTSDVAAEDNDAARLYVFDEGACFLVKFRSRKTDK